MEGCKENRVQVLYIEVLWKGYACGGEWHAYAAVTPPTTLKCCSSTTKLFSISFWRVSLHTIGQSSFLKGKERFEGKEDQQDNPIVKTS